MESFLSNLSQSVEQKVKETVTQNVLQSLALKLSEFAKLVTELPEMKEKGVTADQVLECWNSVSDFKVTSAVTSAVPTGEGAGTPGTEKKTRAKTDKNVTCKVPKTRGEHAGEPCGKNCVVGTQFCSSHLKTGKPTPKQEGEVKSEAVPQAAPASSDPSGGCKHILQNGVRKDKECGKKCSAGNNYCTNHKAKYEGK